MISLRARYLAGLLFALCLLVSCGSSPSQGSSPTATSPTASPTAVPPTATATVDPSNVAQLLARAHEKGPQDVTYRLSEKVTTSQGSTVGTGTALFTRSPQRFLLDVQFSSTPSLSRHQVYDYMTKKITTTRNGTTQSTTSNIEPYYALHNGHYLGKEMVNGETAYHVTRMLYHDSTGIPTELWVRASDLYVVKVMQHAQVQGITDEIAYTDPVFNKGITIPAP